MNVRRIPRAAPKRPASKTTLSRGDAWPDPSGSDAGGLMVVQSSRANTNAAKSTSCASSRRRSSVVVPGLKDVVHGSTCATSSRPRVSACSSFSCFPDEPRKMRGLSIRPPRRQTPSALVLFDLLGEIVLHADLIDQRHLRFQPVDVLLFVVQDRLEKMS